MLRALGQSRHEGHGGRSAPDHHHSLSRVVQIAGPVLGVNDRPRESLGSGEVRRIALVVAVVAGAHEQEAAGEPHGLPRVRSLGFHRPARVGRRPLGVHHPVVEADPAVDAPIARRVTDVLEDRRPVGDGLGVLPRPKRIPQGVHVGVRADPRVAEQVPGAADGLARLQDRVALPRAVGLEVMAGADPGQAGAHDQHFDVLHLGRCLGDRHPHPHATRRRTALSAGARGR